MPWRIAPILAALLSLMLAPSVRAADPRGDLHLVWTAPGTAEQTADAYELRSSSTAPGSDLLAWWDAATPLAGAPAPAAAGTVQSMRITGILPGSTLHAAIRARFGSLWSEPSPVAVWTAPAGPWAQSLEPTTVDAAGARAFTVRGYGLIGLRQAIFTGATGTRVSGGIRVYSDSLAVVTADVAPLGVGTADLELVGSVGSDTLRRWLYVSVPVIPDTLAPTTVSNLTASAVDHQSILLSWTAPSDPTPYGTVRVTRYEVRRKEGSAESFIWSAATPIAPPVPGAPGAQEALLVSGLTPNTTLSFALAAVDAAGNWALPSNAAEAMTLPPPDLAAPAAVTDLAVDLQADGGALLRWTAPADDRGAAAAYRIWRWDGTPAQYLAEEATLLDGAPAPAEPGLAQSWVAGSVAAGTRASFRLAAVDAAGNEAEPSNLVVVDRTGEDIVAPCTPAEFTAAIFNHGTVQLRWIAPGDDDRKGRAERYELRHLESPPAATAWWETADLLLLSGNPKPAGKQEFVNLTGVLEATSHGYALRALDEAGNASPWALAVITLDAALALSQTTPPPAPDSLVVTREGDGVRLVWAPVPFPGIASYRIYCARLGEVASEIAAVGAPSTQYLDLTAPATLLRYAVSAVDEGGNESRLAAWVELESPLVEPSLLVSPEGSAWRVSIREPLSSPEPTRIEVVDVAVFDVLGRLVARVPVRPSSGGWEARWSGDTQGGGSAAQGIYFLRASTQGWSRTQRILVGR